MAGLRLICTMLVLFLMLHSRLSYGRPLRDYNNYDRSINIDNARRYINGFLDYLAATTNSVTTDDDHHETFGYVPRQQASSGRFNVLDYGAVADGYTDSANAFLKAWDDFCEESGHPTLVIPSGKVFLLTPVTFQGPCKSPKLQIELQGTIIAPGSVKAWTNNKDTWIQFDYVNGLTITGGGTIDGQGQIWWDQCQKYKSCTRPTALSFHSCNELVLNAIHHVNSQRNHISIDDCNAVEISHLTITAPENSPNTDGIDIAASSYLNIHDSFIGTGDDCIAINAFTSHVNISRLTCGPGHGISIGSLGKNGAYETVEDVHVVNCTFENTMFGARIKTWEGGRGYARRVSFKDIILVNAGNPIIIDQAYMDTHEGLSRGHSTLLSGDHVEISDVTYKGVVGTCSDERAVYLNCAGCKDIHVENVQIAPAVAGKQLFAACNNAHGRSRDDLSPKVSCLMP